MLLAAFALVSLHTWGQKGKDNYRNVNTANTIVNTVYTSVTANLTPGTTTIPVTNSATITPGDLIMIIQMQGTRVNAGKDTIYPDLTNSLPANNTYGAIVSYNNCGNYEFAQVNSVPNGSSISVDCGLNYAYTASGKVQVIKVPRYTGLDVTGAGSITCPAWNGTTGGIVVVEVDGATTLSTNGAINVSAKGFRGGGRENSAVINSTSWGSTRWGEGGYKGESIAGDTNTYKALFAGVVARGAVANGGGGGDAHNAGGGGGANGGLIANWNGMGVPNPTYNTAWALEGAGVFSGTYSGGGRGGYSYSSANKNVNTIPPGDSQWGGDKRRQVGGLGGRPLDYTTGRLFLGGGGGSGDENDNMAAPPGVASGGTGGGLVYILSYATVSGSGTILADGGNGANTYNAAPGCSGQDGAGGGGAGGTVIINALGAINLSAATAISAKGGKGGNQNFGSGCFSPDAYGPGGGGGGGYVALSSGTPGINVNGGANGIVSNNPGNVAANFPPNGATSGGSGTTATASIGFTITAANATICAGDSATLTVALNGNIPNPGPTINWYTSETGGSPFASGSAYTTPALNSSVTYYVSTCPGIYRIPVTVTVNATMPAPTAANVSYCENDPALPLTATGTGTLNWWGTNATGGTSSPTAPTPSTAVTGTTTYYVSQSAGSCESIRIPVTVTVSTKPLSPAATSPITYCQNDVATALSATANGSNTLNWWGTTATGGTSSATAPTPSTSIPGTTTYYVSQSNGSCESVRTPIQVVVNVSPPAPTTSNVSYCQNSSASPLTAGGSGTLTWWTSATGGTGSGIAPTPSTTTVGTTTYYVSQTSNGCEGSRAAITVTINTSYTTPATTNLTYCQNEVAQPLTATGTGTLNWWGTNATGGTSSTTAPTPSTSTPGTTTYYVSQGSGNCESARATIDVVINATPPAPAANGVAYCQNEPAQALNATGAGTLNWWGTNATGGTSSTTAPIPSTASAGITTYYVSQSLNGCESNRTPITVTVHTLPQAPMVSALNYCQYGTATALTANGTQALNWYGINATGGTASANAPVPSTATAGTFTYYVSQGSVNCESPRAAIQVTINPKPNVTFSNNNSVCTVGCVTFTDNSSVNCSSLLWDYGDGTTGSGSSPTHCYTNAGSYQVSAICNTTQGCADTFTVQNAVVVTATPIAAFTVSPALQVNAGSTVTFNGAASASVSYIWHFNDPASGAANTSNLINPAHTFNDIGLYCVELKVTSNTANCKDSATLCVEVITEPEINIPNIFTPNDDAKNDVFNIRSNGIKNLNCVIYDRWGLKIYDWDGTNGFWDGRGKSGNKAPDGVYYYIVNSTDLKGHTKSTSGYLQLISN